MALGRMFKKAAAAAGVEATEGPSAEELARTERHRQMIVGWNFVRRRIDDEIAQYFKTQNTAGLEELMDPALLQRLVTQMDVLRGKGLRWSQPDRDRTGPGWSVIDEVLDKENFPLRYTVQETFSDWAVLETTDGHDVGKRQAGGVRRIIRATVTISNRSTYKLTEITRVGANI